MTETFGLMVAALLVGAAAVTVTILLLDRFLVKAFHEDKQQPRPQKSRRARKAEKKPTYSPTARPGGIVYPDREGRQS